MSAELTAHEAVHMLRLALVQAECAIKGREHTGFINKVLVATEHIYGQACAAPAQCELSDAGALEIACTVNRKLGDVLAGRSYLLPGDLAALKRFDECASDFDSGGHDVPKNLMARLREIGVVQTKGFGRHEITSFGMYVLERDDGEACKLPLKTYVERCEESRAAIQAQASEGASRG